MSDTKNTFDSSNYMTIIALEDSVVIVYDGNCEYGVNGVGWYKYLKNSKITLNSGESASFRSIGNESGHFNITGQCGLSGNVMSLLFGDNAKNKKDLTGYPYAFSSMFTYCRGIRWVSSNFLPATTLASGCYRYMFSNCTSLTTAPELPATTLADNCYNYMFTDCTNLTTAPKLPATTLASYCYGSMFSSCTSLVNAPELPATTLASGCYQSMFSNCTSLTTAPELPATTLADYCYYYMFYNCSKLNYIKMLATDISANKCLNYWVYGVSSTGTFIKNKDATWDTVGVDGVPEGWTVKFDGEEEGLEFPIHLTSGDNGGLGVQVFDWLVEKISSSNEVDSYTLSEEETLYINGYQVKNAVQYYEDGVLFSLFERPANLLSVGLSNDGFVLWYLD